jgi:trehalose 6-phosphate synthase
MINEDIMPAQKTRLVAVSNRLPIVVRKEKRRWRVEPGSGGLVTAMAPVLKNRGGLWIGWPGTTEKARLNSLLDDASAKTGYKLIPVPISEEEADRYYLGYANSIIWPLFHDLQSKCEFRPRFWYSYMEVNRRFARTIADHTSEKDYIWIHDYHLVHVSKLLKELNTRRKTGFFLHIPFPPLDVFVRLPWRVQFLEALMEYNMVGFQTARDRKNFLHCLVRYFPGTRVQGRGSVVEVHFRDRMVRVGNFPISIDFAAFEKTARSMEVATRVFNMREYFQGQKIIVGIDRMDYTKGIQERLEGYHNALLRYPELRTKMTLVQVLVPSRREIREYKDLKAGIDRLISEINGEFATLDWNPIHYHFQSMEHEELLSLYRAADIALITPLKDGMNLVAKEYCACSVDNEGVLILSEFAGAAADLQKGAILVNPHDYEAIADALHQAVNMEPHERNNRMKTMRSVIRKRDIFSWVDSFLGAAFAVNLKDFPEIEEYVPGL